MSWKQGSITLDDGSQYSGQFFVKEDGQLDKVFKPDVNEEYVDEDEELLSGAVNPRSTYQLPSD